MTPLLLNGWADKWEKCPWALLPSSAKIDIGLWLAGLKPRVRLVVDDLAFPEIAAQLNTVFPNMIHVFGAPLIYLCLSEREAVFLHDLDNSSASHEELFGLALGYPECCANFGREIGESNIDWIEEFRYQIFPHSPLLISTEKYKEGIGLISHLPCTLACTPSHRIADDFLKSLKQQAGGPLFRHWRSSLLQFFEL